MGTDVGIQVDNALGENDTVVVGFDDNSKLGVAEGHRVDLKAGALLILKDGDALGLRELGLAEGVSLGAEVVGFIDGLLVGFAGLLVGQVNDGDTVVDGLAVEGALVGVCWQNMEHVLLDRSHTALGLQQSLLALHPT